MSGHSPVRVSYSPVKVSGTVVLEFNGGRHDWALVAEFCAVALGLKVLVRDPAFDSIVAARKVEK